MSHTKKQNVAIITFLCPYPVSDGGSFGVFSFVNDVRKLHHVTLAFKVDHTQKEQVEALQKLWPDVDIRPLYTNNAIKSNAVHKRPSLYKKLVQPIRVMKFKKRAQEEAAKQTIVHRVYPFVPTDKEFIDFLEQLFSQKKFDIVQLEYSDLLNFIHIVPGHVKKIFFQHENRFSILEDYFKLYKDTSLYASYTVKTVQFTEINLMNLFDRVLVLNAHDRDRLSQHIPAHKIKLIPTTVPNTLIPQCKVATKAKRLVFLGSQQHHPNMDAVKWFSDEMRAEVFKKTQLQLYVTGTWKDAFKLLHPHIHFTGFVEDLAGVLEGGILIAPIRLGGGGIRIKILQAMAAGIPVVATRLVTNGMEGLNNKENIFWADTVQDFVEAIVTLSNNGQLYQTVRQNGLALIQKYYSEAVSTKIKEDLFEELIAQ